MNIVLHLIGWAIVALSGFGFLISTSGVGQIIAAILNVAGWVCIGAASIISKLEEINGRLDRFAVRSWNLGIATIDQLRHPNTPQASPTPADEKFRDPIRELPSWEKPPDTPQTTPHPAL